MDTIKKSLNVLLADDDPRDHKRFDNALRNSPHPVKIQSVYNGLKLIDYLTEIYGAKRSIALPDIIITDLYMPFAGGLQVLKQMKKHPQFSQIPIFVFSANFDGTIQRNVIDNGAAGFYRKPGADEELQNILNGILERQLATA